MADTQEQLLTEITALDPTDFVRVVNNPTTLPDSAVMQKSKFVDSLFGDVITPTTNGAVNDWAPTGLASAHVIRIFPSGPTAISGITTGVIGRVLFLFNVGTSLVRLLDESTLSASTNRIQVTGTSSDYMLPPDAGVILIYDTTTSRWRVVYSTTVNDGWNPLGGFFTFVSVDGSTTVVTCTVDVTSRIQKGTRLRYAQNQSLSALWNFDGGSVSNVGSFTAVDTDMTYTAGKFSNAATFNGTTSRISITDNVTLKPTGEFTIGFWMKTSATGVAQNLFQSFSQNANMGGFFVRIDTTNVIRYLVAKNTGTTLNTDYNYLDGTTSVADGSWHYIVVTSRNNWTQIYVDGKLENAAYTMSPVYAATNYVRLGVRDNAGAPIAGTYFNGQMDDLFLINGYALDEGTIKAKYLDGVAQSSAGYAVTKYGIVTDITPYSGSTTTITFWGGTDFASVSGTFGTPYYSSAKVPQGFNANPEKWQISLESTSNAAITSGSIAGNLQLTVPIGTWLIEARTTASANRSATSVEITMSLSESSTAVSVGYERTINTSVISATGATATGVTFTSFHTITRRFSIATIVYVVALGVFTSASLYTSRSNKHYIQATLAYL